MVIGPVTVLLIHSGQDWIRGSERVLLDLAAGLSRERFRAVVWCDSPAWRQACREGGIAVVEEPLPGGIARPWWRTDPQSIFKAVRVIGEAAPGIVHVNNLDDLPWALRAARRSRLPIIAHIHSPTAPVERIWSGVHQVTVAVGVSRYALEWVESDGMPAAATRLIYNGIVPERLELGNARDLRTRLGVPPDAMVAATVGSLIPRKDVATVVEAVRLSGLSSRDFRLLVVGDGEERPRLEALVERAGMADRVHFLGYRPDVGVLLRDATALLISAASSEAFPLNLLEAGYFGLPLLVTDIPPHREVVIQHSSGLLFPPGDSESLARELVTLQRDPALRRRLGEGARQRVRKDFMAERVLRQFEELYREAISRPRWRNGWLANFRFPRCYRRFLLSRLFGRPSGDTERPIG